MSDTGKWVGMILSSVMFAFSAYMYTLTGDWVAAVFALGSVGYGLFLLEMFGSATAVEMAQTEPRRLRLL
jgi:hypothetical protein